jgi:hypothetical protein
MDGHAVLTFRRLDLRTDLMMRRCFCDASERKSISRLMVLDMTVLVGLDSRVAQTCAASVGPTRRPMIQS